MKTTYTIIITALLAVNGFLPQQAGAQSPEKISYQAVVRDGSNELVSSSSIRMRISILQGSISGTAVYVETQTPAANTNGLVSFEIGNGTVVSGDFATIDWSVGLYFIKTETDPIGGTSYTITGTSQLLSVPYALYAKTSGSATPGPQGPAGIDGLNGIDGTDGAVGAAGTNGTDGATGATGLAGADGVGIAQTLSQSGNDITLSDGGGMVIITDTDTQLDETAVDAFVANNGYLTTVDGSETKVTAGTNVTVTGTGTTASPYVVNATSSTGTHYLGEEFGGGVIYYLYTGSDGQQHGLIVNKNEITIEWQATGTTTGATSSWDGAYNTTLINNSMAADFVNGLIDGGFTDWYLPSIDELSLLWQNRFNVNKALNTIGATLLSTTGDYWSSTEYDAASAFAFGFRYVNVSNTSKPSNLPLRAVRAF